MYQVDRHIREHLLRTNQFHKPQYAHQLDKSTTTVLQNLTKKLINPAKEERGNTPKHNYINYELDESEVQFSTSRGFPQGVVLSQPMWPLEWFRSSTLQRLYSHRDNIHNKLDSETKNLVRSKT